MADNPNKSRHFLTKEESRTARARNKGRLEEREHLRLEIPTREILQRMSATVATFVQGYEDVLTQVGDTIQQPLTRERIAALKSAADIDRALLDRTLPPLKAMEPPKPLDTLQNPASLTDNELRNTVAKYMGIDADVLLRLGVSTSASTPDFSVGKETLQ